mgnify:CR=1 FL=1
MGERTEALMRIVVGIVSGIILGLWKTLIQILAIVQFVIVIITTLMSLVISITKLFLGASGSMTQSMRNPLSLKYLAMKKILSCRINYGSEKE